MENTNFSIKPVLNYHADKSGRHTLVLQVIYQRKRGVIFTPYKLFKEEFDSKKGLAIAINRTHITRDLVKSINAYIVAQIDEIHSVINELESQGVPLEPTDITGLYRCRSDLRYFNTFVNSLIKELLRQEKFGTATNYRSTLSAFERFMGNNKCRLSDIDTKLIMQFINYLRRVPIRNNTISFYIRSMRSIYNKARRSGLVSDIRNPFEAISVREDRTRKLAVTTDVMKSIANFNLQDHRHAIARDVFLFSFYARGMSFVDIAYLQRSQITNGSIYYNRRKTGQPFSVKIIEPMSEIIDRYVGANPWIFPLMIESNGAPLQQYKEEDKVEYAERIHKRYKVALSQTTQYLGVISKQLDLEKGLSFNVARHTWASVARDRGIPVSIISGGLGHSSEKTTIIYLDDLDNHRIDEANDIVTAL